MKQKYESRCLGLNLQQDNDNDVVIFDIDSSGKVFPKCQVTDYICRPRKLSKYNILDYFTETYEEVEKAEERIESEGEVDMDRKPGRPKNQRATYLEEHPKHHSARRVIRPRNHNTLPNFIGRYFPRRDHLDPFFCASMLVLLKPWRNVTSDLKEPSQSWTEAFQEFLHSSTREIQAILSNIQYFHECEIAASANREQSSITGHAFLETDQHHATSMEEMSELAEDIEGIHIQVSPDDIDYLMSMQCSERDMIHGQYAVEIAKQANIFPRELDDWPIHGSPPKTATGADLHRLEKWKQQMKTDVVNQNMSSGTPESPSVNHLSAGPDVVMLTGDEVASMSQSGPSLEPNFSAPEQSLEPLQASKLDPEQYEAFSIIRNHLDETLAGKNPTPLRMITYGEGGTGKSQVIQTTTEYFDKREVPRLLLKSAYTGIAASLVKGKTTHYIGQISYQELDAMGDETRKKLEKIWQHAAYLIIDEFSMISKSFLARLSRNISVGVHGSRPKSKYSFGGINVILFGDLHQFPPVVTKTRESLFYPTHMSDTDDAKLGRMIYEEFKTVVILRHQHRVKDPIWKDFLNHLRKGDVRESHLSMLRELVIGHPKCPPIDSNTAPWNKASLVTPRHGVRNSWNEAAAYKWCQTSGEQLFICDAEDTIKGRTLDDFEKFTLLKTRSARTKQRRRKDLPNRLLFARGMKVMVTTNIETDLDVANGARGEIVDIILDPAEEADLESPVVKLKKLPAFILVKLGRTRATTLEGLDQAVIPIEPATIKMQVKIALPGKGSVTRTITRRQYPMTAAYAFTDYRAQGQTIHILIVDIARPPHGQLSLFNVYVALSRGVGQDSIRLLRDFDEEAIRRPQVPELAEEDDRLEALDSERRQTTVAP